MQDDEFSRDSRDNDDTQWYVTYSKFIQEPEQIVCKKIRTPSSYSGSRMVTTPAKLLEMIQEDARSDKREKNIGLIMHTGFSKSQQKHTNMSKEEEVMMYCGIVDIDGTGEKNEKGQEYKEQIQILVNDGATLRELCDKCDGFSKAAQAAAILCDKLIEKKFAPMCWFTGGKGFRVAWFDPVCYLKFKRGDKDVAERVGNVFFEKYLGSNILSTIQGLCSFDKTVFKSGGVYKTDLYKNPFTGLWPVLVEYSCKQKKIYLDYEMKRGKRDELLCGVIENFWTLVLTQVPATMADIQPVPHMPGNSNIIQAMKSTANKSKLISHVGNNASSKEPMFPVEPSSRAVCSANSKDPMCPTGPMSRGYENEVEYTVAKTLSDEAVKKKIKELTGHMVRLSPDVCGKHEEWIKIFFIVYGEVLGSRISDVYKALDDFSSVRDGYKGMADIKKIYDGIKARDGSQARTTIGTLKKWTRESPALIMGTNIDEDESDKLQSLYNATNFENAQSESPDFENDENLENYHIYLMELLFKHVDASKTKWVWLAQLFSCIVEDTNDPHFEMICSRIIEVYNKHNVSITEDKLSNAWRTPSSPDYRRALIDYVHEKMSVSEADSTCIDLDKEGDCVMRVGCGSGSLKDIVSLLVVVPFDILLQLIRNTREGTGALSSVIKDYLKHPNDTETIIKTLEKYVGRIGSHLYENPLLTDAITVKLSARTKEIKNFFESYSHLRLKKHRFVSNYTPWQMPEVLLKNISPEVDWRHLVLWTCLLQFYQTHGNKHTENEESDTIDMTTDPETPKDWRDYLEYIEQLQNVPTPEKINSCWNETTRNINKLNNQEYVMCIAKALWGACFEMLFSYNGVRANFQETYLRNRENTGCHQVCKDGTVKQVSASAIPSFECGRRYWEVIGDNKKAINLTYPSLENNFKPKAFVVQWMRDDEARIYSDIQTIAPDRHGTIVPEDILNTWPGFRSETLPRVPDDQVDSLVQPILDHIRMMVVEPAYVDYFVAWLAQIVQDPSTPTRVAILLKGLQGVGKNIVLDFFGKKVLGTGTSFQCANAAADLFGTHSVALQNRVFVIIDEVSSAAINPLMSRLKNIITAHVHHVNPKNLTAYDYTNLSNIIATTNDENSIRLEPNERRFVVFDCSASKMGDEPYFRSLAAHLARDDVAIAFFQYLYDRVDVTPYTPFQTHRPKTDAYIMMQQRQLPLLTRFISKYMKRALNDKYTKKRGGSPVETIGVSDYFQKFLQWGKDGNNNMSPYNLHRFGNDMMGMLRALESLNKGQQTLVKDRTHAGFVYKINWVEMRDYMKKMNLIDQNDY